MSRIALHHRTDRNGRRNLHPRPAGPARLAGQVLTSSRLPSRQGRSVRLADLAAATGARTYLCGTGGMTYLDPAPFTAQNVAVAPFRPPTAGIWSFGRRLSALWALAELGPDTVADRLQTLAADHTVLQPAV
ncbi:WbqC family protein [Streptomyces sp. NPDC088337]|uniref:WbqC family protein n=1 Tax=unclassified Streptomyces TaxID=2593676 RepID=UPI0037FE16D6